MTSSSQTWAGVAAALLLLLAPHTAFAGNLDGQLITLEAAMQAGEITAGAQDTDALWYNPAGLAPHGDRSTVSVGLSAYGLQFSDLPPLIVDNSVQSQSRDLSPLQLTVVPAGVAWTKPLTRRLGIGMGAFTPVANQSWTRNALDLVDPVTGETGRIVWESRAESDELYVGAGIGGWVSDSLRLGVTLFGIYASTSSNLSVGLGGLDDTDGGGAVASINGELSRISFRLATGAQWDVTRNLTLGLAVQSPVINAWEEDRVSVLSLLAEEAPGTSELNLFFERNVDSDVVLAQHARVFLGAQWSRGAWRLAAGGSWRPPLNDGETQLFNWRGGLRYQVNKSVQLGGGFFSDRAPIRAQNPDNLPSASFYGGTLGIRLATLYGAEVEYDWYDLPSGRDDNSESPPLSSRQPVEFVTSLVFRYAYGSGTGRTFSFATQGTEVEATFSGRSVDIHELALMLSSGVRY